MKKTISDNNEAFNRLLELLRPGTLSRMEIAHDDWCDFINNHGECNCEPIITIRRINPQQPT